VLEDLAGGFVRLYPAISISLTATGIAATYGDHIDLTIYRYPGKPDERHKACWSFAYYRRPSRRIRAR
jgi:hypothetical protein